MFEIEDGEEENPTLGKKLHKGFLKIIKIVKTMEVLK